MKKHKEHSFVVDEILKRCEKESSILEIGCGEGTNILKLNGEGYQHVEGFDKNPEKIQKFSHLLEHPSMVYVEDINEFSSDKRYDVIFHSLVGIFLSPPEREKMVQTIYSHLKLGGYYILEELKRNDVSAPNLNRPPFFYSNQEIEELDKLFLPIDKYPAQREVNGNAMDWGVVYIGRKIN